MRLTELRTLSELELIIEEEAKAGIEHAVLECETVDIPTKAIVQKLANSCEGKNFQAIDQVVYHAAGRRLTMLLTGEYTLSFRMKLEAENQTRYHSSGRLPQEQESAPYYPHAQPGMVH